MTVSYTPVGADVQAVADRVRVVVAAPSRVAAMSVELLLRSMGIGVVIDQYTALDRAGARHDLACIWLRDLSDAGDLAGALARADSALAFVGGLADDDTIAWAIRRGVRAFVRDDEEERLVELALRSAVLRQSYLGPTLAPRIMRMAGFAPFGGGIPRLAALTPREREVAALVAQGLTNVEVAKRLTVSIPTVKSHLASVYEKLGLHTRVALARAVYAQSADADAAID